MPQASIREVAKRAGVSVGTVSNVLNRPDLVAEETRVRVLSAIDELGFVRNESARRLRQGPPARSRAFGVLIEDVANPYYTDVAQGAESALNAEGVDVIWCTSNGSADKEHRALELLVEQRVAGVLITPIGLGDDRLARLHAQGMAVVVLDRHQHPADVCSARVDHVAGGEIAVDHLLRLGHDRIAFVTGGPDSDPARERRDGAVRALARAGGRELVSVVEATMTATAGQQAARRLLDMAPAPSAVFCANDLLAIGVINELLRYGVKVPEEIAVIGYDDIELAATAAVPLTTVRQPRHELGRAGARLALAEAREGVDHRHRHVVLTPELIIRNSG
ncbi:LacI family DNA-binding transcriptional regulator [Actinomadura sp. HBU206391]|uniref:LacI family DNA-binding transcriptional regulator n=1 Tax=Actinomadura sp. HBU206391 TaxID=2731692 RepID=UPI00165070B8|nr:LacI family DNA-binding transcriptional regulator [Actinomadura sp. HBU206391]MBC6458840.1 LacI family DNA-binding transcriptional regulator [Actinomadura sp. HBU206391]